MYPILERAPLGVAWPHENRWIAPPLRSYPELVMHDFPPLVPDFAGPDVRAYTTPTRKRRAVVRRRSPRRISPNRTLAARSNSWCGCSQQLPALLLQLVDQRD